MTSTIVNDVVIMTCAHNCQPTSHTIVGLADVMAGASLRAVPSVSSVFGYVRQGYVLGGPLLHFKISTNTTMPPPPTPGTSAFVIDFGFPWGRVHAKEAGAATVRGEQGWVGSRGRSRLTKPTATSTTSSSPHCLPYVADRWAICLHRRTALDVVWPAIEAGIAVIIVTRLVANEPNPP